MLPLDLLPALGSRAKARTYRLDEEPGQHSRVLHTILTWQNTLYHGSSKSITRQDPCVPTSTCTSITYVWSC
jgi:hypothetical protein